MRRYALRSRLRQNDTYIIELELICSSGAAKYGIAVIRMSRRCVLCDVSLVDSVRNSFVLSWLSSVPMCLMRRARGKNQILLTLSELPEFSSAAAVVFAEIPLFRLTYYYCMYCALTYLCSRHGGFGFLLLLLLSRGRGRRRRRRGGLLGGQRRRRSHPPSLARTGYIGTIHMRLNHNLLANSA